MSASLVGSEMCIRDRGSCRSAAVFCARPKPGCERDCSEAAPRTPKILVCLLYTSDAADDM
eukprot:3672280-Alexandrium_andersonii.AAC.1